MLIPLLGLFNPLNILEFLVVKDNKILYSHKQRVKSPLNNWVKMIHAFYRDTSTSVINTSGDAWTFYGTYCYYCNSGGRYAGMKIRLNAGSGVDDFGLVVGYGTAPVSPDDYKLDSQYPHGTGLGYLEYRDTSISDVTTEQTTINDKTAYVMKFSIERQFYNNCDNDQEVTEVGLIARIEYYGGGSANVLIYRDLLDTKLTIPAYSTGVLRYEIRFICM